MTHEIDQRHKSALAMHDRWMVRAAPEAEAEAAEPRDNTGKQMPGTSQIAPQGRRYVHPRVLKNHSKARKADGTAVNGTTKTR